MAAHFGRRGGSERESGIGSGSADSTPTSTPTPTATQTQTAEASATSTETATLVSLELRANATFVHANQTPTLMGARRAGQAGQPAAQQASRAASRPALSIRQIERAGNKFRAHNSAGQRALDGRSSGELAGGANGPRAAEGSGGGGGMRLTLWRSRAQCARLESNIIRPNSDSPQTRFPGILARWLPFSRFSRRRRRRRPCKRQVHKGLTVSMAGRAEFEARAAAAQVERSSEAGGRRARRAGSSKGALAPANHQSSRPEAID